MVESPIKKIGKTNKGKNFQAINKAAIQMSKFIMVDLYLEGAATMFLLPSITGSLAVVVELISSGNIFKPSPTVLISLITGAVVSGTMIIFSGITLIGGFFIWK